MWEEVPSTDLMRFTSVGKSMTAFFFSSFNGFWFWALKIHNDCILCILTCLKRLQKKICIFLLYIVIHIHDTPERREKSFDLTNKIATEKKREGTRQTGSLEK